MEVFEIQGKSLYAKIGGDPVPGYEPAQLEWTTDLVLDDAGVDAVLKSGASKQYIKETKMGEPYVKFTRRVIKKDGTKAKPITIVDDQGKPWEYGVKIGNGSVLKVRFTLNEVGKGKDLRLKPSVLAIQVWSHVPYSESAGFTVKSPDEAAQKEAW